MAKFPTTEAEITALCQQMIAGIPSSDFRASAVTAGDLQNQLDKFIRARSDAATALQKPEQPRTLEAAQQGDSWVFLDWKELIGGGAVAFYRIERRARPDGDWGEAGSAIPNEYTLINQPKGVELEYRVVAVNRAGESLPSNAVTVVL